MLVNNAYTALDSVIKEQQGGKFHQRDPVKEWDTVNGVGLRNHYLCTTYAAK